MDEVGHATANNQHAALRQDECAALFQQAVRYFQAGRMADAEALAQNVLASQPEDAATNHLLGLIAGQRGQYELADRLMANAVRNNSNEPSYLLNRGLILQMRGDLTNALAMYEAAIELNPLYAAAHCNRGNVLCLLHRVEEGLSSYDEALRISPRSAEVHNYRGLALCRLGRLTDALAASDNAVQINPNYVEAYFNRGNILRGLGRLEDAILSYERVVRLNPAFADAYLAQSSALDQLGRHDEALASCDRAIERDPRSARAHGNRGDILRTLGRFQDALSACDTAIRLDPDQAEAHNLRGNALFALSRAEEALLAYDHATRLKPAFAEAHYNRGSALLRLCRPYAALAAFDQAIALNQKLAMAHNNRAIALSALGDLDAAELSYRRALELSPNSYVANANLIFFLAATARLPPHEMFAEMRRWLGACAPSHSLPIQPQARLAGRRLRVGYVSPDLRNHAVSYFFEPLLTAHDASRFEIFCYDVNKFGADDTTARLRRRAEHWRDAARLGDAQLARLIRDDGIDVLVDLAGHTTNTGLPAFRYRPAPVQVTYLGFFASTGLETMNYWLTDAVLHPADTAELATEAIYRLPRCWVCYQPPAEAPAVSHRPDSGDQVVFGSFSNLSKLTPEVIETWCRILRELPRSRMLLMDKYLGEKATRELLAQRFARHGITAERLLMRPGAALAEYLATYAEVDVVLDAFPRTGGTTTVEALWMGVPVVVLAGQRYAGRISVSKLTAVGLEALITESSDAYVRKAVTLAQDYGYRSTLRADLRDRMAASPLCDRQGLARAIESAYVDMWQRSRPSRQASDAVNTNHETRL